MLLSLNSSLNLYTLKYVIIISIIKNRDCFLYESNNNTTSEPRKQLIRIRLINRIKRIENLSLFNLAE